MAKRRPPRVTPTDPNPNRLIPQHRSQTSRHFNLQFIFYLLLSISITILSFYIYRSTLNSPTTTTTTTTSLTVYERGLVTPNIIYQQIITENYRVSENVSRRHYTYPILAYITPWNSRGYEMAKKFNSKFTHLSPVWYDLKSEGTQLILEGRHNADLGWMSELRKNGHALVMPRIVLEVPPNVYLSKKKQRDKIIDLIVTECRELGYDGIILESWSRWAAYGVLHDPDMRNKALKFIRQLGQALHSITSERNAGSQLQLVYVIGPPHSANLQEYDFGPEDLQSLGDTVDGFSLMTYDFSNPHNPGPNAPLKWIQSVMRILLASTSSKEQSIAYKIFIGINFYGNDFLLSKGDGGGAITGRDYVSLLEKYRPVLQWDEKSEEHMFVYSDTQGIKHAVFYPSLMSISLRLEDARAWGAGISIWEIGQGLDYFFDLL
ncbi:hypothetical protein ACHQM5_000301 [Ranunculus cassubicifolius]